MVVVHPVKNCSAEDGEVAWVHVSASTAWSGSSAEALIRFQRQLCRGMGPCLGNAGRVVAALTPSHFGQHLLGVRQNLVLQLVQNLHHGTLCREHGIGCSGATTFISSSHKLLNLGKSAA